ncbi:MAG: Gfo/Idh/MocA family oxidoreductase, partial [Fuerstiella sp.]|nr:Gfo/Idh/MocA family oxidoreductase [Fuerstiella sp.]
MSKSTTRNWQRASQLNEKRHDRASVCDVDPEAAEACRGVFGAARASSDWREIIDDDSVDLIVLATHTNLRRDLIIPALEAGKPVF